MSDYEMLVVVLMITKRRESRAEVSSLPAIIIPWIVKRVNRRFFLAIDVLRLRPSPMDRLAEQLHDTNIKN